MTGKLRNYQIQMLDSLSRMEEYRKQLEAEGMTTIDGETYMGVMPIGTVTGRFSDAGNPRPFKELEPRRVFPEPPLGTDYAAELAGADYAATEARFLAHYAGHARKLGDMVIIDELSDLSAAFFEATKSMGLYVQQFGRARRPFRTRKQRRIAAQLKRVRPLLGVGPNWRIGRKEHND